MNSQSNNKKITRRLFALAVYCLSALLITTQTTAAEEPLNFSTNAFSLENMMRVHFFSPQAVLVVNTTGDQNDQLPGDGFCNDGAGNCSLRAAIQEANAFAGAQTIDFNLPGSCGGSSIVLNSPLPDITDSVTIDGYSNPGALTNTAQTGDNANLCVLLDGSSAGNNADGLRIAAVNTTIRGLVILNFGDTGIEVNAAGGIVEGNFIGTNRSGTGFFPNRFGVSVSANNAHIGGATLPARNIISGNTRFGIALNQAGSGGTIQNNYIGLDSNSAALGNGETGISIFRSSNNLIGGTDANARNVISGNGRTATGGLDGSGIYVFGDQNLGQAPNNTIQGNYIGTNPLGDTAIANKTDGILINGAINTTVAGNVVSGNRFDGIGITGAGATNNIVKGNSVGLDANRVEAIGNTRHGINIIQVGGNTIGGTSAGDGNRIGSNGQNGVLISGTGGENNSILGNFIGFNVINEKRQQNNGIALFSNNNIVGGTAAGARNYIAGNLGTGVYINLSSGNNVIGNHIGLTDNGTVLGNTENVTIEDATNNIVGGATAGAGNVLSGGFYGVRILGQNSPTTGNQVLGNLIGTTADGMSGAGNGTGVLLQKADNNVIGGTTAAARNVISGNISGVGVRLVENSKNNQVLGNYIGTKIDGLTALPNSFGVMIEDGDSTGNVIGGTATGAGNVVSGNGNVGILIKNSAASNRVEGNIVGLKADGTAALPNSDGIGLIDGAGQNVIGGTTSGAGNVVSGNTGVGIYVREGSSNRVEGNKVGTDATGTINLGNGRRGVAVLSGNNLSATGNIIGGTTVAARNIISANQGGGVQIDGSNSTNTTVAGNYIGIKADGISSLPNGLDGVLINSPNSTVGGATAASRNVISGQSGNGSVGISVYPNSTGSTIQNNYIGTTADGSGAAGNYAGIQLGSGSVTIDSNVIAGSADCGICVQAVSGGGFITNNKIGTNAAGTAVLGNLIGINLSSVTFLRVGLDANGASAPNIITGSTLDGIRVFNNSSNGNLFYRNSIYGNGGLGIDLDNDGVTQNDNQDADGGPNNLQNFPVINIAGTIISGNFNSTPNRNFQLQFFSSPTADPTGYGEGQTFIADQSVTTNASGNATFSVANPQPLGSYISATAIDSVTGDTSEFSAYKQTLAPTAVTFNGARAKAFENGVLIEWQTGREADNLGFNVYRERDGKSELLTKNLVAGSALTASENLLSEQNYSWFDKDGDANATYSIEAIDTSGAKQTFGAFQAEKSLKSAPEKYNSATITQIGKNEAAETDAAISRAAVGESVNKSFKASKQQTEIQKILAANSSVKLSVRRAGIYRVSAEELFANGLPADFAAANLRLFADGIEQPINVTGAESGVFDKESAVEFYGTGANTTETDARIYYLTASQNQGLRMRKSDLRGQPTAANGYDAIFERRDRTIYFSGLLNGDQDNFFGAVVNNAGVDQTISAAQINQADGKAQLEVSLQGVTKNAHVVSVELNDQNVGTINFDQNERGAATFSIAPADLQGGENVVKLRSNGAGDISVVDFVKLTYPHLYRAENNSLDFAASGGQEITVGNFTSKDIRVFDVTDPNSIYEIAAELQTGLISRTQFDEIRESAKTRGYTFKFTAAGNGKRHLLAVSDSQTARVESVSFDNPSNLRDRRNAADLLILTKREFFETLAPLVKLRESQGLRVKLIDVADIYDEFSFGQKSSASIKSFLNLAAASWSGKPQFVLLAGDATFDPKGYLGNPNADVVQTKLVDTDSIETASDEWFADFDGDGVGELSVGRLPARTNGELSAMVAKIVNYDRQSPSNAAAFVADVSDGYDYAAANKGVSALLPQNVEITDIRRENADAKSQLMSAIKGGQSIVSYSGHGSSSLWRGNLLNNSDAANLTNSEHLPLFLMMTCLNGYFQDAGSDSLSETLLKNPNGGAAAVWASSGTVTPDVETDLNREFIRALSNGNLTIGQAARAAKSTVSNQTIRQTWTLLGDPTMRLK